MLQRDFALKSSIHRILSGAPTLVLALAALWATAFPTDAANLFKSANSLLADPYARYVTFGALAIYCALWWWSGTPSKDVRKLTQRELRTFRADLSRLQGKLGEMTTEASFKEVESELQPVLKKLAAWLEANMDQSAVEMIRSPSRSAVSYIYTGEDRSQRFLEGRDNILGLNAARLKVLDDMIKYDGWDKH